MKQYFFFLLLLCLFTNHSFAQIPEPERELEMPLDDRLELIRKLAGKSSIGLGYFRESGNIGLVFNGERITEAIYGSVELFSPHGFIVTQNRKCGFVNPVGKVVIPIKYDGIERFTPSRLKVKLNEVYGIFDANGNKLIPVRYKKILDINEADFCAVEEEQEKLTLLDQKGQPVYEKIDGIQLYKNGAIVYQNGKAGLVTAEERSGFIYDFASPSGSIIKENQPSYDFFTKRELENVVVTQNGKAGLVDNKLNKVVPIEYDEIEFQQFKKYYVLTKDGKKGVYFGKTNLLIKSKYDGFSHQGKYLKAYNGKKSGLIDPENGKVIIPIEFEHLQTINKYYKARKNGKWGLMDATGATLISFKYDAIETFYGLNNASRVYRVKNGELKGAVDINNKLIIPIAYDWIGDFDGKYLMVRKGKQYGLYDLQGKQIVPVEYEDSSQFNEN